jgi:hypothetical protein
MLVVRLPQEATSEVEGEEDEEVMGVAGTLQAG